MDVRGEIAGWDESRQGKKEAPSLAGQPRFIVGQLQSRYVESLDYFQFLIEGVAVDPHTIERVEPTPMHAWDDAEILWPQETKRRRDYRALQSWYRETVLNVPPGGHSSGRPLGSLLPVGSARQGLNFIHSAIAAYAWERADQVSEEGGALESSRLERNMLSSMPLCFNLFGHLRSHRDVTAKVLSRLLKMEIETIDGIEVEYAPQPASDYLNDRTAFDAFVSYLNRGRKGFLAIETKYTEPFSQTEYVDNPNYARLTTGDEGFREGALGRLTSRATNQLWRNTLLAMALHRLGGFDESRGGGFVPGR